jgi:5-methylcytosine-specific restriction endonuclease McrA
VLRDHQGGRCLYCRKELRGAGCVDHFIAWSRYPVDLGHNLVLVHDNCNAKKRDFLAYPVHLERWQASHLERGSDADRFVRLGSSWRDVLGPGSAGLRRVAEPPPPPEYPAE